MVAQTPVVSMGGAGGGGSGAWVGSNGTAQQAAAAGVANTGGGGGGGAIYPHHSVNGASGGSGIVCFREAQELPELAGTWVLNERLYAPTESVKTDTNFSGTTKTGKVEQFISVTNGPNAVIAKPASGLSLTIYSYSTNQWNEKYDTWTFPAGATASDEFRAWLARNATKQA